MSTSSHVLRYSVPKTSIKVLAVGTQFNFLDSVYRLRFNATQLFVSPFSPQRHPAPAEKRRLLEYGVVLCLELSYCTTIYLTTLHDSNSKQPPQPSFALLILDKKNCCSVPHLPPKDLIRKGPVVVDLYLLQSFIIRVALLSCGFPYFF